MQTPQYGALGAALQLARVFQMCSLIAIIGMTANFISEIVSNDLTPPDVLIGTISIVSPHINTRLVPPDINEC